MNKGEGERGRPKLFSKALALNWRNSVYHTCHSQKLLVCTECVNVVLSCVVLFANPVTVF